MDSSFSADIISITQDSNIGVPGQFIFLTNGNISDVQCNTTQGLQSSPFRGSMHGGYPLRLFGLCFPESSYIVEINGQELSDCQVTTVFIACTMPMVSEGRLQIRLLNSERRLVGQTNFSSFLPETNADVILSNHGDLINKPRLIEARRLQLHFQKNALTTNYLFRIIFYDYSTQYIVNNNTFYNLLTRRVDIGLGFLNLSIQNNLTINFSSIFPVTGVPNDRVHLLDISFELILPNTTIETLTWKGTQQFITRAFIVPNSLFSSYCTTWLGLQSDANTQNLTKHVPGCPCRVRTEWDEEQFGFNADPVCNARKSGTWNCEYQRKAARGCYRRKSTTSDGGAHCCYDNTAWVIDDLTRGGGSMKAHYPETSKALSTHQHFFTDFLPYFSCCGLSTTTTDIPPNCAQYMRYRPTGAGTCIHFIPLPVVAHGDPHFSTLKGDSYTFNGHGEYTLLKSIDGNFEIQVRLARLINESANPVLISSMDNATAILAFVIHNEDQPRVQFELFSKLRLLEIRVDDKLLEFTPLSEPDELLSSSLIYFDDRQLIIRQRDANSYSISYGESGIQFIVYLRPQFDFLDFMSIIPKTFKENSRFQGILGGFEGLAYANGTNVSANLNDDQALFTYGESWRTTSDSSLFYYRFQDSHAEHQDLTYRPIFQHDLFHKYANTSRYQMAEEVCHKMTHLRQCMYDVLITNDVTIGQMHEQYETNIQALEEYIELVTIDIENRVTTTTVENSETTTSVENSQTTPKPQNTAAKYFVNDAFKIVLLALIVICH